MFRLAVATAFAVAATSALEPCTGDQVGMAIMDAMTSREAEACGQDTGNDNLLMNVWTHEQALKIAGSANCEAFWTLLSSGVKTIDECIYDPTTGMTSSQYAAQTFTQFAADLVASTAPTTTAPVMTTPVVTPLPNATQYNVTAGPTPVPQIFF
nr:secreted protein [Achlya hypogyna]